MTPAPVLDDSAPVGYARPVESRQAPTSVKGAMCRAPGRPPRRHPAGRRCARCQAFLSQYNEGQACGLHAGPAIDYNPRHDKHLPDRIMRYLSAAYPSPVDLAAALGTTDNKAVHDAVVRLRAGGRRIEGCRPRGYRLAEPPPAELVADGVTL